MPQERIELSTSPLPRVRSTTELLRRRRDICHSRGRKRNGLRVRRRPPIPGLSAVSKVAFSSRSPPAGRRYRAPRPRPAARPRRSSGRRTPPRPDDIHMRRGPRRPLPRCAEPEFRKGFQGPRQSRRGRIHVGPLQYPNELHEDLSGTRIRALRARSAINARAAPEALHRHRRESALDQHIGHRGQYHRPVAPSTTARSMSSSVTGGPSYLQNAEQVGDRPDGNYPDLAIVQNDVTHPISRPDTQRLPDGFGQCCLPLGRDCGLDHRGIPYNAENSLQNII